MLRFVYFEEKHCLILAQTTHAAVTIRKQLLRLSHARVTGYTAFCLLRFRKFPLWIAFSNWNVFTRFCAGFHRFRVNAVALVSDDYETEMKLVVCWTGILWTLNGNFLVPVVSWPAIVTDLKKNGRPTLLYDRILADGRSLFSSLSNNGRIAVGDCLRRWPLIDVPL